MRYAFRQGAVTQGVDDDADLVGAGQGEGDFGYGGRGPAMGVLRQGLLEAGEASRSVMEIRDGLVEPAAGEIGQ